MKLLFISILTLLALFSCNRSGEKFWPEDKSPEIISRLVIHDLLNRPDFMMYKTEHATAVHYAEVCTAFGAARLAGLFSDEEILRLLSLRYMKVLEDSIVNTANHVDANVYGILPLELFIQTRDSVFYRQGIELAIDQWKDPLPDGLTNQTRYWIDDIWMIGSLQIQAYRVSGDQSFLDKAALETVAYLEKLQQPNGLFFHGENAPFYWGRGNGWVAAGLAEVISELPKNHPLYPRLENGYKRMMKALLGYQCEDGMWRQLIDNDTSWKESSCTGMFAYAIAVGVNRGILPRKNYKKACQNAWMALTDYISDEGLVRNVCVGTGQSTDVNYYLNRPTSEGDFHGQAPILWLAYMLLQ
jgi:rhamnogalacturonyl hydrolase YesR